MGSGEWRQQNNARAATLVAHAVKTAPGLRFPSNSSRTKSRFDDDDNNNNHPTISDLTKRDKNSHG
jgi:hypothetical protein